MQVKLLKDIFLSASIKKAGKIVTVKEVNGKLRIEYRTCCSKAYRELAEDEYELINNDNN